MMADSETRKLHRFHHFKAWIILQSERVIFVLLALLTAAIVLAVLLGVLDLVRYLPMIFGTSTADSYRVLRDFLGQILLLVIGLEIASALIKQKAPAFLNVMIYGVTMKVLLISTQVLDLLLGALALGVLFLVKRYLLSPHSQE